MVARVAYAVLAGIIAMIVCIVLGDVFNVEALNRFAGLIGLLVAVIVFFSGRSWGTRTL